MEAQLGDFAQTVKAGSRTELAMLYRLRDMLLSQRAYLTAMVDYTAHGGKSRGSAPRPIPEDDDFFENVWRSYRETENVD